MQGGVCVFFHHPQEDLTKFGYRPDVKVGIILRILFLLWPVAESCCRNLAIFYFKKSKSRPPPPPPKQQPSLVSIIISTKMAIFLVFQQNHLLPFFILRFVQEKKIPDERTTEYSVNI